jgi:hypothetical protein
VLGQIQPDGASVLHVELLVQVRHRARAHSRTPKRLRDVLRRAGKTCTASFIPFKLWIHFEPAKPEISGRSGNGTKIGGELAQ